jgi:Tfp pilus assembly protein PilV
MRLTGKHLICRRNQQPTLKAIRRLRFGSGRLQAGYSLMEVVLAAGIIAVVYGMIIKIYIQSGMRAQWSGYSLAAQSLATEQVEQARSASWDPSVGVNQMTQFNNLSAWSYNSSSKAWSGYTTGILDVPYASTNFVIATNFVTIQAIYLNNQTNPPVQVQMVTVQTVWPFFYRSKNLFFTNTAATWLAPDNRDINSM